jgi:hypothetical protein
MSPPGRYTGRDGSAKASAFVAVETGHALSLHWFRHPNQAGSGDGTKLVPDREEIRINII